MNIHHTFLFTKQLIQLKLKGVILYATYLRVDCNKKCRLNTCNKPIFQYLRQILPTIRFSDIPLVQNNTKIPIRTNTHTETEQDGLSTQDIYLHSEFGRISSYFFHDLIKPLNTLTFLLSSKHEEPKIVVSKCLESCNTINTYISKYRDFIHNANQSNWYSIHAELCDIISLLRSSASLYSVHIYNHTEKHLLFGNRFIFIQIITNILSNAIDSHKDTVKIEKRIDIFTRKQKESIKIIIKDNGIGIPKEAQNYIFKSVYTNKGDKGSGIGLFNTKIHMKKYFKGHITFTSKPGKGTTFYLVFPIKSTSHHDGNVSADANENVHNLARQTVQYLF